MITDHPEQKEVRITTARVLHVHIPGDFEGEIHIYVDTPANVVGPSGAKGEVALSPIIGKILERFESHDSATAAREVHDALVARGWRAHAPNGRSGNESTSPYVRLVYKGSKREVSVFLNTVSLAYGRKDAALLVGKIDGAELHADGLLYIYHSDGRADKALAGMNVLEDRANGKVD